MDTSTVKISVLNLSPKVESDSLLALADVELLIDGIGIVLHGVQVVADERKTVVRLPRYRAADGSWKAAVSLPEEVKGPIADAVIAAGIEAGILKDACLT